MKRITIILLILPLYFLTIVKNDAFAQFEGVIEFEKVKTETTRYQYLIKGHKIRLDEFGHDGSVKGIMIIDTKANTVTALNPERKLFMDASNKKETPPVNPKVEKTSNTKEFFGYSCKEWIVKSEAENTEIRYWATEGFPFFAPLLKTLNRKDKLSRYFLSVDGIDNIFTFKGEERSLTGEHITTLQVTGITKKSIADSEFDIPADYVKFEK